MDFNGFAMCDKSKLPDLPGEGSHDFLGRPLLHFVAVFADKQQLFMLLARITAPDKSIEAFHPVDQALLDRKSTRLNSSH